jgi:hypothetical protein
VLLKHAFMLRGDAIGTHESFLRVAGVEIPKPRVSVIERSIVLLPDVLGASMAA